MSSLDLSYLAEAKSTYGLLTFVETGCFTGDGIAAALAAGFATVHSCDILAEHVELCQRRFSGRPVHIWNLDSIEFLEQLLPLLSLPTFFWLDAHYPGFYGRIDLETDKTRFPLRKELELIAGLKKGFEHDVIVCDDIRVINDRENPRWQPGEVSDYFAVLDQSLIEIVGPLQRSHDLNIDLAQEGMAICTPKESSAAK